MSLGQIIQKLLSVRNKVIAAIISVYLIGAFFWVMPLSTPLKPIVVGAVTPVFAYLGLWQSWDMFAPNPRSEDLYLTAEILLQGEEQVFELNFSNMRVMPYFERYRRERWRKFFNDSMAYRWSELPQVAEGVYQIFHERNMDKKITTVNIWKYSRLVQPGMLTRLSIDEQWTRAKIYSKQF